MISSSINNLDKSTIVDIPEFFTSLSKRKSFIILNKTFTTFLAEAFLILVCSLSDYVVFKDEKFKKLVNSKFGISIRHLHVLLDNGSHCMIGLLSCLIFSIPNISVLNLLLSAFISSFIDIDHFISAKSFSLEDAVSLPRRPFMHNTLTLLLINLIILIYFILYNPKLYDFAAIIFMAWFSHHLRDANRHGLWFGYEVSTPPINDHLYIGAICALPLLLRFLLHNK